MSEECIFCGCSPCECNGPAPSKKAPAKKTESKPKARSKLVGSQKTPVVNQQPPKPRGLVTELSEEEMDFRSCVRALEPILSLESKLEVSHILNSAPSLKERVYSWKKEYSVEKERANESSGADRQA